MNAFRKVREYFVFTRNEQKILLLLSVVFLAGAGIKAYRSLSAAPAEPSFEYAQSDSIFAARSASPQATDIAAAGKPLDLNRATRAQLIALPGIGPKLADRMLAYRAAHVRFRSVKDVRKVAGIGPKKFERLQGLIVVNPDSGR
jgi:competence ComEA-like helix-hairpin-helix protein